MREFAPLPLEARRAAWDALWKILLAPAGAQDPPRSTKENDDQGEGKSQ